MIEQEIKINFDASASLRKWPSRKNAPISVADGARPYLVLDGTLRECIDALMTKPISQHHLYEIHTTPQGEIINAVLSWKHILELARLQEFL
jgi:hypothetical protein